MLWKFFENQIRGLEALLQLSGFVKCKKLLEQRPLFRRQDPFSGNRDARRGHISPYNRGKESDA